MNDEFTPGPWTAEYHGRDHHVILCSSSLMTDERRTEFVAEIIDPVGYTPRAERRANARLISAAPDLLAVSRKAEKIFQDIVFGVNVDADTLIDAGFEAAAAIAKATGKAEK